MSDAKYQGGRQKGLSTEIRCLHVSTALKKKLPTHIRYSSMRIPREGQGVGFGGAPVQGPGDVLKPLGTDLRPYRAGRVGTDKV